jgi:excisionase family DNA binding protein
MTGEPLTLFAVGSSAPDLEGTSRSRKRSRPGRPRREPTTIDAASPVDVSLTRAPSHVVKLLLTPTEAALALGIGRSKLYELMRCGRLESVLIDSSRRIPAAAIDRYVEELRCAATSVNRS